jgi:hypothetical protein
MDIIERTVRHASLRCRAMPAAGQFQRPRLNQNASSRLTNAAVGIRPALFCVLLPLVSDRRITLHRQLQLAPSPLYPLFSAGTRADRAIDRGLQSLHNHGTFPGRLECESTPGRKCAVSGDSEQRARLVIYVRAYSVDGHDGGRSFSDRRWSARRCSSRRDLRSRRVRRAHAQVSDTRRLMPRSTGA